MVEIWRLRICLVSIIINITLIVIIKLTIIITIVITRPKLARQGLAHVSLRASGSMVGSFYSTIVMK